MSFSLPSSIPSYLTPIQLGGGKKSSLAHFLGLERKVLLERNRQDLALGILDLLEADEPVLETLLERQSAVEIDSGNTKLGFFSLIRLR